ncbi:MAG: KaiC domain-containing protein [Halodesulfurarchaeum sp.]|nr:KaiC domain-containing protein [Halodesulfurarchaeum sp.]
MAEDDEDEKRDWFERAVDESTEDEDRPEEEDSDWEAAMAELEDAAESDTGAGADPGPSPAGEEPETEPETGTGGEPVDSQQFEEGEAPLDIDLDEGESFGFDMGGDASGFEEETYHAEIPRLKIGIEGLDAMIQEGIPERSLLAVIGGAGTGKTTFALQFIQGALESGEKGVYITLEESRERIYKSAQQKGWDFEGAEADGDLAILDLDPVDMANSLTSIRSELPRLVENFGAERLALDSVSLLEMMYDEQATRRTEIYDFARSLKEAGVTTLVTSEASSETAYASRFGIIEYLTDGVFILQYIRPEDFQETRLAVEIQKIRDANHARETKPYEITNEGISVYRDATIF